MSSKNISQINSKYFDFNKLTKSNLHTSSEYRGWHGLSVIKFDIPKGKDLSNYLVDSNYKDFKKKEKIFVVTKGKLKLKSDENQVYLNEYDAVNFISEKQKYEIQSIENTTFFMISAKEINNFTGTPIFFNFKKDTETRDLWGGQCISKIYEGKAITLVLFDLKPGFKFEDKGHTNEQITWLTQGEMNFYANGEHKTLTPNNGVDIGPNHVHGGISNGAIGFDAFFPKRQEEKYKKNH